MYVKPSTVTVDGVKFVSVADLVAQIDEALPLVALHGLANYDEQYAVGMIQGYEAIKKVVETA